MPMYRKSMLVLLVLVLAVAGGMAYGYQSKDAVQPLDTGTKSQAEQAQLAVYVTGAVNKPGVVSLADGARVADAVNACGGLLPTADAEKVNMAQTVKDGQQIRVPEKQGASANPQGKAGAPTGNASKSANQEGLVNINTADEKALDTLPGIGPAMAKRIIEYRETQGAFQSVEDLKKIKGIGEAKFEKMKDKVTI